MASDPYRSHRRHRPVPQFPGGDQTAVAPMPAPVRVLALVQGYVPDRNSGAETMLRVLLRDLVRRGHQVRVVTQTRRAYELDGVEVLPRKRLQESAGWAHMMVGHLGWTRELLGVANRFNLPIAYLVHNQSQVERWRMRPGNITIAVWNSRHIARKAAGKWTGPSVVVRPPVLWEDYGLHRDPWYSPYVTTVNATTEKGVHVLYELAGQPPAREYMVVEGGYGNQQLPKLPNVRWQPKTPHVRDRVLAVTRVMLMLSFKESWGRAACEAMMSGIPVIAHPAEGLRESLGDAAIWVDRSDRAAVRAALDSLDDPDIYRGWSARARERGSELNAMAKSDLDVWELTVRRCAAVNPGVR